MAHFITGDKGKRETRGGRGGREHTFIQHTEPSGNVFTTSIDGCTSYHIKFFNCEKWGYYDNQCPEPTGEGKPNNSGKIWHKSAGVSHKAVVAVQ